MADQTLAELMIIKKARQSNYKIIAKSWLIMMTTWALWLYAIYFLGEKYEVLLNRPFVAGFTFKDVLQGVFVLLLVQLNLLFLWSVIVKSRVNRQYGKRNREQEDK